MFRDTLSGKKQNRLLICLMCVALFVGYAPYLLFEFGFHNDFAIWEYPHKLCCSSFVETQHLIKIGRFIQAYLQGFFLMFFDKPSEFVYGRVLSIIFYIWTAFLLFKIMQQFSIRPPAAAIISLLCMLLPPAQINVGWLANFVPGAFNSAIVLTAAYIFSSGRADNNWSVLRTVGSGMLLVASLFIYPPTIGFFLLPALLCICCKTADWVDDLTFTFRVVVIYLLCCFVYFIAHRTYLALMGLTFNSGELYEFDVSAKIVQNISGFIIDIMPSFLNLFFASDNATVALVVGGLLFFSLNKLFKIPTQYLPGQLSPLLGKVVFGALLLLIFGLVNMPGLVGSGGPPQFFRAWHPGMVSLLIIIMIPLLQFKNARLQNVILVVSLSVALCSTFINSHLIASTLSSQLKFAEKQFATQFEPNRYRYILVEARPPKHKFSLGGWGEFGFIHVLSSGVLGYILQVSQNEPLIYGSKKLEWIVADEKNSNLVLERSLLHPGLPDKIGVAYEQLSDRRYSILFDKNQYSGIPISGESVEVEVEFPTPQRVACYSLTFQSSDEMNFLMPKHNFFGRAENIKSIAREAFQSRQPHMSGVKKKYTVSSSKEEFLGVKIVIPAQDVATGLRFTEIELFSELAECQQNKLETAFNEQELKTIASVTHPSDSKQTLNIAGLVEEIEISDPPFRLQRAFDDIYYTFWETSIRGRPGFIFKPMEEKKMRCYAFKSGQDNAHARMPKSWDVFGKINASSTWKRIDSVIAESPWGDTETRVYRISDPRTYEFFKIEFHESQNDNYLRLYEIKFSDMTDCSQLYP